MDCTVVIPSYNRLPQLLELLAELRHQNASDFEILVIEQSTDRDPELLTRLAQLAREEPRLHIERHPPLGVGGARNQGLRSALGRIVLFIDDDDLPAHRGWIQRHCANYADPHCIAVHGGEIRPSGEVGAFERIFPRLSQACAMRYSPLGTPLAFPGTARRKTNCRYLRGGNSSIRRELARAAGGWVDECENGQEEHDFSFRLRRCMGSDDYIAFDPGARIVRRLDIPGGAGRRTQTLTREIAGNVRFYYRIVPRHMPLRFAFGLPFYPWVIALRAVGWILDDRRHEPLRVRLSALALLCVQYPYLLGRGILGLFTQGDAPVSPVPDGSSAP